MPATTSLGPTEDGQLEEAMAHPEAGSGVLGPGDALYLPIGWFHCMRSLSVSASVNFWFR